MRIMRNVAIAAVAVVLAATGGAAAQGPNPQYPPFDKVIEGHDKIVSIKDGQPEQTLYTLYKRQRDGHVLAVLPQAWASQKYFIALTLSAGTPFAGLQTGDEYVYWRQYDNRIALVAPNLDVRSTGDAESKSSVQRLYTDQVLLDLPIATLAPPFMTPVIDLKSLCVDNVGKFFRGAGGKSHLASLKTLKAFPQNIEIAYEMPTDNGQLRTFHYSISVVPPSDGYKPRVADPRIGYFTTTYRDFGKYDGKELRTRYINRWQLEKADPNLKVSPPKKPITYILEHTTPLRYRRWVAQGALYWNAAFEKVGISNAIEILFQDASTGAHMEKDPEDVRYNFIRWLNNGVGLAIGPSRVNPLTGEILDADVIITDGWVRAFQTDYNDLLPQTAMEGLSSEAVAWVEQHPQWDPRLRLASPNKRQQIMMERMGRFANGGRPVDPLADLTLLAGKSHCLAANGMAFNMDQFRLTLDMMEPGAVGKPDDDNVDGIPSSFVGPLLADLVAHEVGHTLGLRHNFKASSIYTLAEINSDVVKGKKPFAGSVMDYIGANIVLKEGKLQGDWSMIGVGPYDFWAIEYGYTTKDDAKNLKDILGRVAEPELAFGTDEDTAGPDPLARRYDFSKNPLDFAKSQAKLAKFHRERLLDKFVKTGDNWARARKGYQMTLNLQTRALSMMANWVGGAYVHRDHKGDPKERQPLEVVSAAEQRAALDFVLDNAFKDEVFGLTPALLQKLVDDGNHDDGRFGDDSDWPLHDRVLGVQTSVLTMLMNPTTLRRVYDNEFRVPAKQDAVTLPELLDKVANNVWTELDPSLVEEKRKGKFSAREPMISSLRRNLQREHLDRLVDLCLPGKFGPAAYKPIANLATQQLRDLQKKIATYSVLNLDPYTRSHLSDAEARIKKALDASLVITANGGGNDFPFFMMFGNEGRPANATQMLHPADCNCGLHRPFGVAPQQ